MEFSATESRVLVLAPTKADAQVSVRMLGDWGISAVSVEFESALADEIRRGAGAVVITDDLARREALTQLRFVLDLQPSWSELPILLLARPESPHIETLRNLPGVVVLERPVHVRSLVSAVQAALRARHRQYELRNQLEQTRSANLELRNAGRAKDEFLATLSHELRNPLSALTAASNLLERPGLSVADSSHARQIVRRQAAQMTRLLDDLLDVSRITHGRLEIKKSRSNLADIVKAAVETVQPQISRKQHKFTLTLPQEDVELDADAVRLSQVIANLLTNAAKYTEPGGQISLTVQLDLNAIEFVVRDNGIGIDAESKAEIFGMFSQLRPALERSEGGLGIGLALAKGLVDLHGGTISVASDGPGRGSEFTVRIPHIARAAEQPKARVPELQPALMHSDLIIADDNVDAADSLATLLELEGHEVRVAHDGKSVLRLAGERIPGIMLLDIGMPDMNGYEVARAIRERHPGKDVVLVALTGWGQPGDKQRAREAGFDHHLTKPVDFEELTTFLSGLKGPEAQQNRLSSGTG